jgi:hypothetical protein
MCLVVDRADTDTCLPKLVKKRTGGGEFPWSSVPDPRYFFRKKKSTTKARNINLAGITNRRKGETYNSTCRVISVCSSIIMMENIKS